VQFVRVPDVGVPRIGVTNVGVFAKTNDPVPVSSEITPAKFALVPEAKPVTGRPEQLVNVPDVGVPKIGVINVGVLAKTSAPVPVSSEIKAANPADVVTALITPVPLATDMRPVANEARICLSRDPDAVWVM
jgi:hypothetical protein